MLAKISQVDLYTMYLHKRNTSLGLMVDTNFIRNARTHSSTWLRTGFATQIHKIIIQNKNRYLMYIHKIVVCYENMS